MKILVINSGSSSIKFQLISMEERNVLAKGLLERIGIAGSRLKFEQKGKKQIIERPVKNHEEGIHLIVRRLTDPETGVIKDKKEIFAIGHRVVHAGERFKQTALIDNAVIAALKECVPLAPLHNPPNITGIEACLQIMPGIPMAAVFDTAFHQTMPEKSYIYPIPFEYYEKYGIRRYGFHGTSHFYVAKQAAARAGKPMDSLKIITCHLGNGSSVTAIDKGKSIDTSMGFTPLEGLPMGTRSGDLDPAILLFLMRNENLSIDEMDRILNKKSGIQGISEISSDMRDIETRAAEGDHHSQLAIEILAYRIKKYIGAYIAAMNGVDLLVFTAGIGENDSQLRRMALEKMDNLGIQLDNRTNQELAGQFGVISVPDSPVTVMVIPTNEELEIAEQTLAAVSAQ